MKNNGVAHLSARVGELGVSLQQIKVKMFAYANLSSGKVSALFGAKVAILALSFFLLFGCSTRKEFNGVYYVIPYQEEMVVLQNLKSRVLAYCYPSPDFTADDCAKSFEEKGFVRLKDIPRFPAKDDFLKADTYPTRRWRKDEKAPRW